MFRRIQLRHWRQFNEVSIKLGEHMTVLTGENGTGKTTILNILSRHFGWKLSLISTPLPISKRRATRLWSDVWEMRESDRTVDPRSCEVGEIEYTDDQVCKLLTPPRVEQAQYRLTYQNQTEVPGLHVPSHTPSFSYHHISDIPTDPKTSQQQYQLYQTLLQEVYQSDHVRNPAGVLKQSLISLAVFGYGNAAVVPNPEYRRIFEEFQEVLRTLLPKCLGFRKLEIRVPDIVLVTDTGDFSLDAASGGVASLVGIGWQIYMYGAHQESFVVTIDEPESHLHPSMQREILPSLFRAFPRTQFVIATHSPFIASSLPEARVYALVFNESRRVDSSLLETADLSGTANQTLREILGVPLSVPVWVEDRLRNIIEKYRAEDLTPEALQALKAELVANGLGALLPDAIQGLGRGDA